MKPRNTLLEKIGVNGGAGWVPAQRWRGGGGGLLAITKHRYDSECVISDRPNGWSPDGWSCSLWHERLANNFVTKKEIIHV